MTIRSALLGRELELFGEDPWAVLAEIRRELTDRLFKVALVDRITSEESDFELALASRRDTFERKLHRSGLTKAEFGALLAAFAEEKLK